MVQSFVIKLLYLIISKSYHFDMINHSINVLVSLILFNINNLTATIGTRKQFPIWIIKSFTIIEVWVLTF